MMFWGVKTGDEVVVCDGDSVMTCKVTDVHEASFTAGGMGFWKIDGGSAHGLPVRALTLEGGEVE